MSHASNLAFCSPPPLPAACPHHSPVSPLICGVMAAHGVRRLPASTSAHLQLRFCAGGGHGACPVFRYQADGGRPVDER